MKICNSCKSLKPLDDFAKNVTKPDGKSNICRGCKKEYNKEYYKKTKQVHNPKRYERRDALAAELKQFVLEYKLNKACLDCKNQYPPYVMDFDHLGDKKFNISDLNRFKSLEVLQIEIAKCELVCANCHRIRTHGSIV